MNKTDPSATCGEFLFCRSDRQSTNPQKVRIQGARLWRREGLCQGAHCLSIQEGTVEPTLKSM